ncbi:hypothetical protein CH063_14120, partial [Colletotrichum higginsianum]
MKQVRETTPPADSPSSVSSPPHTRATNPPCDETLLKGAPSSSSDPPAPCSIPPSTPRADTAVLRLPRHQEEKALRETAHAAEGASKDEERGRLHGADGATVSSEQRAIWKRQGRSSSKGGVPVLNPMNKIPRSILSGGLTGGINTLDRGKDTSQKRLPP